LSPPATANSAPPPESSLIIPLYKRPLFPGTVAPIVIHEPDFVDCLSKRLEKAVREHGVAYAGLFLVRPDGEDSDMYGEGGPRVSSSANTLSPSTGNASSISSLSQLHSIGTLARIESISSSVVVVGGLRRIRATHALEDTEYLEAAITLVDDAEVKETPTLKAYMAETIQTMRDLLQLAQLPLYKEQLFQFLKHLDVNDPGQLAYLGACLTHASASELQEVLAEANVERRLRKTLYLVKEELKVARLQQKVHREVESKVSQQQQRYFLTEQLKAIKKELGLETDEKETLLSKYRARLADGLVVPDEAQRVIDDEMAKLSMTEPSSSEFGVTRNYLDWLTSLPWGRHSNDSLNVERARRVLDEDHYGLDDVKDRILEFIAVSQLRGSVSGKVLCLLGPPGTGKTSLGKSIARSLDREFYRFSVGGLGDVAEIKGHRRTYVGSMPGKVLQAFKQVKVANPVILIDEVDKLGRSGYHGDPASALLEVLDPEQNSTFLDHYLDVPFDLSKVLFVCTANVAETIPGPLMDRMELMRLSGYVGDEKVEIARQYLVPNAMKESGLDRKQATITVGAVRSLIKSYCREAGVRNLQKKIEQICRKAALRVVTREAELAKDDEAPAAKDKEQQVAHGQVDAGEAASESASVATDGVRDAEVSEVASAPQDTPVAERIVVTESNLDDFVGKPVFSSDRHYDRTPPGVVVGLAWTSMGGATLYVETLNETTVPNSKSRRAARASGGPGIHVTGTLGDVMKESVEIAYCYAKHFYATRLETRGNFFDRARIHVHLPEGATPKDGPSAGVTLVTAFLSLAVNTPVVHNLAMTGEVTLTGKVLAVGGIREKCVAARRSGITKVVMPASNRKDWVELRDPVKAGLSVTFADSYDDVYRASFGARAPKLRGDVSTLLPDEDETPQGTEDGDNDDDAIRVSPTGSPNHVHPPM